MTATSKGKKVIYQSPCCNFDVIHTLWYHNESYQCRKCNKIGPWRQRLRIKRKKWLAKLTKHLTSMNNISWDLSCQIINSQSKKRLT